MSRLFDYIYERVMFMLGCTVFVTGILFATLVDYLGGWVVIFLSIILITFSAEQRKQIDDENRTNTKKEGI